MKRNVGIDLAKTIAIVGVVLLHVTSKVFIVDATNWNGNITTIISQSLYYLGTIAIPFFFLSNGFFLLNKRINYSYVLMKALLIIKIVVFWNLVIFFCRTLMGNIENPVKMIFDSLVQEGVLSQFWFLGSLIIILFLVPFLHHLLYEHLIIYIVGTSILLLISVNLDLINHFTSDLPVQMQIIQTFRLWIWLLYYMIGGLIGSDHFSILKQKFVYKMKPYLIPLTVVSVLYQIANKAWIGTALAEYNYDNILIIIWSVSLFIYFSQLKSFVAKKYNFIIFELSSLSMGVYIIHGIIIKFITRYFSMNQPIVNLLILLTVLILSFFISFIMSRTPFVKQFVKL